MPQGQLLDLGPGILSFNGSALGKTLGGFKFRFSEQDAPVMEDQNGTDSVDDIIVGSTCEFEFVLTRVGMSTLSALIAGASNSGTSGETMAVVNAVGKSRFTLAKELICKPVLENGEADTDTANWLHILKASPKLDCELTFDATTQRGWKFTGKGYADPTSNPPNMKWRVGPDILT